jgi:hypothetical protein
VSRHLRAVARFDSIASPLGDLFGEPSNGSFAELDGPREFAIGHHLVKGAAAQAGGSLNLHPPENLLPLLLALALYSRAPQRFLLLL